MSRASSLRIAMLGQKGFPAVWGGIECHVDALSRCLCARGHDVTVFVRGYYQREGRRREADWGGVRVRRLPTLKTKHFDAITHTLLATVCAGSKFDVVHYHGIGPGSQAALSRVVQPRSARVLTVHALDWQRAKWNRAAKRIMQVCEHVGVKHADRVIAVSGTIKEYLKNRYGVQAEMIPNGIHRPKRIAAGPFLRDNELEPNKYFLFVGRLVPEKGAHLLLDAFEEPGSDWKLVLAGPAQETVYARELRRRAKRNPRVLMPGAVFGDALCELYSNAGVFVLPSFLEGWSISCMEALSYRLPLAASALPSIEEEVNAVDGAEVFLFAPGDSAALKASMRRARECVGRRGNVREAHAEPPLPGMSWEEVAKMTEDVYCAQEMRPKPFGAVCRKSN